MFASSFARTKGQILKTQYHSLCTARSKTIDASLPWKPKQQHRHVKRNGQYWVLCNSIFFADAFDWTKLSSGVPVWKGFLFSRNALFHFEFYVLARCDAYESICFQRAWPIKEGMRALAEISMATRSNKFYKTFHNSTLKLFPLKKSRVKRKEWNL